MMRKGCFQSLKGSVLIILFGLMMMALPQTAMANTVTARNDTLKMLNFAVMHYDDSQEDWLVIGWYSIPANSVKTVTFPDSDQTSFIYLYAVSGGRTWDGRNQAEGMGAHIVDTAFKYYRGNTPPSGASQRIVTFKRYNGDVNVRWTAGQG